MKEKHMTVLMYAVITAFACLMCCSCHTIRKSEVTEVYVHDTVEVHKTDTVIHHRTDTVKDVKVVSTADSVKEKEWHTYILNNVGDTIKEVHHYHNSEKVLVVDSTYKYKAEMDSLRAVLEQERNTVHEQVTSTETVKVKKAFPWDVVILVFFAALLSIIAIRIKQSS